MSKAADYVKQLSNVLIQRPVFALQGPNGMVVAAYIEAQAGTGNGSVEPILVIEKSAWTREKFAELCGWAAEQMNEEGENGQA